MIPAKSSFDVADGFVEGSVVVDVDVATLVVVAAPVLHTGAYDVVESQDFDIS